MEVSITKMSRNGQIVIPAEIRNDAKIGPSTQFFVYNDEGNIYLRQIRKDKLKAEMELRGKIRRGREDIKKGRYIEIDSSMPFEEFDKILMGDYESKFVRRVPKGPKKSKGSGNKR